MDRVRLNVFRVFFEPEVEEVERGVEVFLHGEDIL